MGVAFSSSRTPGSQCFGPFNRNIFIPYSVISLNNGNGYNPALGTHTHKQTIHLCPLNTSILHDTDSPVWG